MRWGSAVKAGRGPEHQGHQNVVVQVLADSRNVELHLDAMLAKMIRGAHPRKHEQLRRANRTARQNYLAVRARHDAVAGLLVFHAYLPDCSYSTPTARPFSMTTR